MEDDKQIVNIVTVEKTQTVIVEEKEINIVSVGSQGPQGIQGPAGLQGPAGPQGPAGSVTSSNYIASSPISGHKIVYLDLNGLFSYASSDNLDCVGRVIGLTLNAADTGDIVEVAMIGEIQEPSWNFTVGLPVFLGLNGNITQTYPTQRFSQIIGFALTSNRLYVKLQEPMILD